MIKPQSGSKAPGELGPSQETIDFVLDVLGYSKSTGCSPLGNHISEARVLQMMRAYDNDAERVIDFFTNAKLPSGSGIASAEIDLPSSERKSSLLLPSASKSNQQLSRTKSETSLKATGGAKSVGGISLTPTPNKKLQATRSSQDLTSPTLTRTSSFSSSGLTRVTSNVGMSNSVRLRTLSDEDWRDRAPSTEDIAALTAYTEKSEITLVVVGHVDAGKSTLVGNLLYQSGQVMQRTIHKYEKDSSTIGKSSFFLAWVMDEDEAERAHGVTIGIAER